MSSLPQVRRRVSVSAVAVLIGASLMSNITAAPTVRAAPAPCRHLPPVFPIGRIEAGMHATGWTVVRGTEPTSFDVKLLGVQPDAIAPGFDVIVVRVSGAAVKESGGIAAGFSGSPVYRGNTLVGSLSWSTDDPRYGALTPGKTIVDLFGYPTRRTVTPRAFDLDPTMRRAIARDAGVALDEVDATMSTIPVSLALAGVARHRLDAVAGAFEDQGMSVVPFRAGSSRATRSIAGGEPFGPGDAFGAALAYGTVTYAAIGTVTAVCGDYLVAFGHSFTHAGTGRSAAAMRAEILAVVGGSQPFKLANVKGLRGVVDQDRLAGVRAIEGIRPPISTTLTAEIRNRDLRTTSSSVTRVVNPDVLDPVAWDQTYSSILTALDARLGTTRLTWRIAGTAAGEPFSFTVTTVRTGDEAVWGPADDVQGSIWSLRNAGDVKITRVAIEGTVTESRLAAARVQDPKIASDTEPGLALRRSLDVSPGDTLQVRVPIAVADGSMRFVDRSFVIPDTVSGDGRLEIELGDPDFWVSGSFEEVRWRLVGQLSRTEMRIRMKMRGMERGLAERIDLPWRLSGRPRDVDLELIGP